MAAVVGRATGAFIEDGGLTHGAAIAFFTGLSIAPILILLIWASSVLGSETQRRLLEQAVSLIGPQGGEVIRIVIENADKNVSTGSFAGWISLAALLVSATGLFAQMQTALNAVWGVREDAGIGQGVWNLLRKRLLSLGLIISLGFLLLVSLVISSALSAVSHWMQGALPVADIVWTVGDIVIPFLVYSAAFMALFRYLPDNKPQWRDVRFGGVATAALFVLGKSLIGLYLGSSALGSAYGAAGSLVLLLVWAYYSASIVLFGAELTQARSEQREERI